MMKTLSKIATLIILSISIYSCNKDYYDMEDIHYEVITPDTICSGSTISIKGSINQDLDIKVYFQDARDEHLIGVLKPYSDSLSWKVPDLEKGNNVFCLTINFEKKKNVGYQIFYCQGVYVKN